MGQKTILLSNRDNTISLREHIIEDLEPYLDWQCNPLVATYLDWLPRSKEAAKESLLDAINEQENLLRQRYFMAIVRQEDGEMVGDTGIEKSSATEASIGWFIRPSFWGNGCGLVGASLMVELSFTKLGILTLRASCLAKNSRSERIMKELGFSKEKETEARVYYMLTREEWDKQERSMLSPS